jgi:arylsulfate sulfotransferase
MSGTNARFQIRVALMKQGQLGIAAAVLIGLSGISRATEADTTSIVIVSQKPGATPFISMLSLSISDLSALQSITFTVAPRPGSVTRPVSATYYAGYLVARGYFDTQTGLITVPVFGLYANYANNVALTYSLNDGSFQHDSIHIVTSTYSNPCGFTNPIVIQARTTDTSLSYDFMLVKSRCSSSSPTVLDTDGEIRWVGTAGIQQEHVAFFDNAFYIANSGLTRIELDGTFRKLAKNYSNVGVTTFHHNIDYGKYGLILDASTATYMRSMNIEVDKEGNVIKTWDLAAIISAAMQAGGDDPAQFVWTSPQSPNDWFHNNATTYRPSDDSIIISSRENFVICLDYNSGAIKWILGDPAKRWYQFPSLRKYALTLAPGSLPPVGQHAVSITYDDKLLLFDNGQVSDSQNPAGNGRPYSSPRKYQLDLQNKVATEVWNYPHNGSKDPYCGSVYEDQPLNYLVDYAYLSGNPVVAELLGLNAAGQTVFDYTYPTITDCLIAFNSFPIHLENLVFDQAGPLPTPTPTSTPTGTPTPTPTATPTPGPSIQVTVQTNPANLSFTVDGTTYNAARTFSWAAGSSHTIGTSSPQSGGAGVQYPWKNWASGGTITHTVAPTKNTTYTANFTTQYYLTMNAGPGGSVSPASGWKNSGVTLSLTATATNNASVSYSFNNWTGTGAGSYSGTNNPASLTMTGPMTETASFTQNPVQVTVQTNPINLSFTVDGTTYNAAQTFFWSPGSSHTIGTSSPQSGGAGVQYTWKNWAGGGAITHTIEPAKNTTYTANFPTQFYLTMSGGSGGKVSPVSGWQKSGTTLSITATPAIGHSFDSWTGSGPGSYSGTSSSASITINAPITEAAAFK